MNAWRTGFLVSLTVAALSSFASSPNIDISVLGTVCNTIGTKLDAFALFDPKDTAKTWQKACLKTIQDGGGYEELLRNLKTWENGCNQVHDPKVSKVCENAILNYGGYIEGFIAGAKSPCAAPKPGEGPGNSRR